MDPGKRPHLVRIQKAISASDNYGGETHTWHDDSSAWASVLYGTGQERREGAQENATLAATFNFEWSTAVAAIRPTWRLNFFDTAWDVASAVVIANGIYKEVHVTAITNLDAAIDS